MMNVIIQSNPVNWDTEGSIESIRIKRVRLLKSKNNNRFLLEQNANKINEDVGISNFHKLVILQTKSTERLKNRSSLSISWSKLFSAWLVWFLKIVWNWRLQIILPVYCTWEHRHAFNWRYRLLVTVFDAILTSRQTLEKFIQCLYENLMSNNFRKAALLKKIWFVN